LKIELSFGGAALSNAQPAESLKIIADFRLPIADVFGLTLSEINRQLEIGNVSETP
jgi:hypothetical protein